MLAGHKDYISSILKVKSNMDSGIFRAMQLAAVEALDNPDAGMIKKIHIIADGEQLLNQ